MMNEYRQNLLKEIGIIKNESEIGFKSWYEISENKILSEEFIREFQDNLIWGPIWINKKFSEDFIREFERKVNWFLISKNQKLSEDFIRDFQMKVDWFAVSAIQQLTDNFITEFKDRMDWCIYFRNHKSSFKIMKKFILKSDIENLNDFKVSHLTNEQKQVIDKMLALKYIFRK
jgi:hypothetical protein